MTGCSSDLRMLPVVAAERYFVIFSGGFQDPQGVVGIQFSNDGQSVECQGEIVCDERIHCATPRPIQVVGMSAWDREVRVSIGLEEYTTTKTAYSYFLNTIAEVANFLKDPEVNREISEDVLQQRAFGLIFKEGIFSIGAVQSELDRCYGNTVESASMALPLRFDSPHAGTTSSDASSASGCTASTSTGNDRSLRLE